jgi:IS6 family transposase
MNWFKHRYVEDDIILWAVRWSCKYGIRYRALEERMAARGIEVDHSTR